MERITEQQLEEARRVLRAHYYQQIRDMAEDVAGDVKRGQLRTAEDIDQQMHETADGSGLVIYTGHAIETLVASDNWQEIEESGDIAGEDLLSTLTAAAFYAVKADIRDLLDNGWTCPERGEGREPCGLCGWCGARALLAGEEWPPEQDDDAERAAE